VDHLLYLQYASAHSWAGKGREPYECQSVCIKSPVLPYIPLRQRFFPFSFRSFSSQKKKIFRNHFSEVNIQIDKMAGRDHVLALPSFVLAFRILQLVTALAIMGLAAYGITFLAFDGVDLTLFTVHPLSPPLSHPYIFPSSTRTLSPLTPLAGHRNPNNNRLHHRRRDRCANHLQLLGDPRPRHLRHRLLAHLLRAARVRGRRVRDRDLLYQRLLLFLRGGVLL
jgi:hypothetical protein